MKKEIALGAILGLAAFLVVRGVDIIPFVLIAALVFILFQTPGLKGMGQKFGLKPKTAKVSKVSFTDIGGQSTAKKELLEALDFLTVEDRAVRLGIRPLKGILLTGPPGTGKTLLAKAAAHHTASSFVAVAGSEFIEVYAGVGAQRVREVFGRAREQARSEGKHGAILFIDELEVLGGKRGAHQGHLEYDQTLNQLLVEMDGISTAEEVRLLVVGATNRPDLLDDALLRPGRFDRIVKVDLPDKAGRLQILEVHTRNKPLAPDVDLPQVAKETFGFSGAHLESLTNEAAILALREGQELIELRHFLEAIDKVIMGEKIDRRPSEAELKRVAVHEGGHALIGELHRPGSVAAVTITPRGMALGYVRRAPMEDVLLETQGDLEADIATALAGAVSEEILLGNRSTGATNDFQQAVERARRMVLAGMSELGVISEELLGRQQLQSTVAKILGRIEEQVRSEVLAHQEALRHIADLLLREERVEGEQFRQILGLTRVELAQA